MHRIKGSSGFRLEELNPVFGVMIVEFKMMKFNILCGTVHSGKSEAD